MDWSFGAAVLMTTLYIRWKYFTVGQPRDMPTEEVYRHSNWNTLTFYFKLRLIKLLRSMFTGEAPAVLSYLIYKHCVAYNFRRNNNIIVLTQSFLRTLLAIEALFFGTMSWLISQASLLIFIAKWRRTLNSRNSILAQSVQSLPKHYQDFLKMVLII